MFYRKAKLNRVEYSSIGYSVVEHKVIKHSGGVCCVCDFRIFDGSNHKSLQSALFITASDTDQMIALFCVRRIHRTTLMTSD